MTEAVRCFRRAEGLTVRFRPCGGLEEAEVEARRGAGGTRAVLTLEELVLLGRLARWSTPEEVGSDRVTLETFVDADFAFFAQGRPSRDLSGQPLGELHGAIALRRNVSPTPLVRGPDDSEPVVLPFMPRRGELASTEFVGLALGVREYECETLAASFACCRAHALLLRDVVSRLDGRHDAAAVARLDPLAPAVLRALDALGMLEARTPPVWDGAARLTWLCHAGMLYEAGGVRLLVDPLEYPCSLPSRHAVLPPDLRDLGPPDAVLITHGDNDHLNPSALCRIPRETLLVVPRPPALHDYQVDTEALLALLGFERLTQLSPWDRITIGEVTVLSAPFAGEDWGLELASQSFVIAHPDATIYLNADSTLTPEAYPRIAAEFAIDLACVGVTGAAEAHAMPEPFGYGHLYGPWIPETKRNEWVQLCNGPREAAQAARALGARFAFGYAAGGGPFAAVGYTDRGTHAALADELGTEGDTRPLALPLGIPVRLPAPPR